MCGAPRNVAQQRFTELHRKNHPCVELYGTLLGNASRNCIGRYSGVWEGKGTSMTVLSRGEGVTKTEDTPPLLTHKYKALANALERLEEQRPEGPDPPVLLLLQSAVPHVTRRLDGNLRKREEKNSGVFYRVQYRTLHEGWTATFGNVERTTLECVQDNRIAGQVARTASRR
jgi:hypothetical protein